MWLASHDEHATLERSAATVVTSIDIPSVLVASVASSVLTSDAFAIGHLRHPHLDWLHHRSSPPSSPQLLPPSVVGHCDPTRPSSAPSHLALRRRQGAQGGDHHP